MSKSGEKTVLTTHPAGIYYLKYFLLQALVLAVAGVFIFFFRVEWWSYVAVVSLAIFLLLYVLYRIKRASATFIVTTERVVERQGFLSRRSREVDVDHIRAVDLEQSLLQRLWGVGDVKIASAGTDDFDVVFRGVPRPAEVRELIRLQTDDHRTESTPRGSEPPANRD